MEAFGFMAFVALCVCMAYPEKLGRWLAKVAAAMKEENRK